MKKLIFVVIMVISCTALYGLESVDTGAPEAQSPVYFGIGVQLNTNYYFYNTTQPLLNALLVGVSWLYTMEADVIVDFAVKVTPDIAIGIEGLVGYQGILRSQVNLPPSLAWGVVIFPRFDFDKIFLQPYAGIYSVTPDYFAALYEIARDLTLSDLDNPTRYYGNVGLKFGGQVGWVDLYVNAALRFNTFAYVNLGLGATIHFLK